MWRAFAKIMSRSALTLRVSDKAIPMRFSSSISRSVRRSSARAARSRCASSMLSKAAATVSRTSAEGALRGSVAKHPVVCSRRPPFRETPIRRMRGSCRARRRKVVKSSRARSAMHTTRASPEAGRTVRRPRDARGNARSAYRRLSGRASGAAKDRSKYQISPTCGMTKAQDR